MSERDDLSDEDNLTRLIDGLKRGDEQVLQEFYRRYSTALHGIVQRRLNPVFLKRFDSDDVVQSTLRTFFRRVGTGHIEMGEEDRVWDLLCAIALTKLREMVRFHRRFRRAVERECALQTSDRSMSGGLCESDLPEYAPDTDVEFTEAFEAVFATLCDAERELIALRLQNRMTPEIAFELGVSERTVQRNLRKLGEKFESVLSGPA